MINTLILDYGHRNTTPGKRTNCLPDRVIHERQMNEGYGKVIAARARAAGVLVLEVAPPADSAAPAPTNGRNGEDTDLYARIAKANAWYKSLVEQHGAGNVTCWYISCHANAASGTTASGAEVWGYSKATAAQQAVLKRVVDTLCQQSGMVNRGVKLGYVGNPSGNFAVNRETTMPSMLIEAGFMTNPTEADKMDKPTWWATVGNAIADGLFAALGITSGGDQPSSGQVAGDGFFACLAEIARPICVANNLSLVLCLAQGGVESTRGTSELGQNANNLFGIKAGGSWAGRTYTKNTEEWDEAAGKYITISAAFRAYDSWRDCVLDWAKKLTTEARYTNLRGCHDTALACKYIQQDGWATSPRYTTTLLEWVDRYGLEAYKQKEDNPMEFIKIDGKVLRCTSAAKPKCETFSTPDVNASLGVLELGESYEIIAKGPSITVASMTGTWYKILVDGSEVYCLDLPDGRCVVEDMPVEPEPEPTPEPEVPSERRIVIVGATSAQQLLLEALVALWGLAIEE